MRATLWIAASGFLLASGTAYACTGMSSGHEEAAYADHVTKASPARFDVTGVTITDQDPRSSAYEVSKTQPAEASSQVKAEARSQAVTVDLEHPGGEFPVGG
jgi:hypothetical protein